MSNSDSCCGSEKPKKEESCCGGDTEMEKPAATSSAS